MCQMCDTRMILQEANCNFPDCRAAIDRDQNIDDYNTQKPVAVIKDGLISAFCKFHREKLAEAGIKLMTINDILGKYGRLDRMRVRSRLGAKKFIASLKI